MNTRRVVPVSRIKPVAIAVLLIAVAVLTTLFSLLWTRIHRQSDKSPIRADPLNLVDAFHTAANGHKVDALLALFTEDATISDRGSAFHGGNEIRNWASDFQYSAGLRLKTIHGLRNGQNIFWSDVAYNEATVQYDAYILQWIAILQAGKIQSLTVSVLPAPCGK
jgi:hypothetical protein